VCCGFFQAEDGIRDFHVTGVQTCALPISSRRRGDNKPRSTYLLTGILYCGRCGKTMVGSTTQRISKGRKLKWSYYRCRTARNYGRIECSQPNLNRFKMDKIILEQVKQKVAKFGIQR